ncbi:MAG: right-handed parallel beta-helix repeat-containing protein [Myxococcota bacterium]|nr:right-handed parallel beta-helix repeat-containing protein [Myxococcota bacterium]
MLSIVPLLLTLACTQDTPPVSGTKTEDNTDCDDDDPWVYTGAPEFCDQTANDCDNLDDWEVGDEDGSVTFTDVDGMPSDMTGHWSDSDPGDDDVLTLDDDGRWDLCEGTYEVGLAVEGNIELVGHGEVILSGAGQTTILEVTEEGIEVSLSDLTLQDGEGTAIAVVDSTDKAYYVGGAISIDTDSTVVLDNVVLEDNHASVGGAIFVGSGGTIQGSGIVSEDNSADAGGNIGHMYGGTLELEYLLASGPDGYGLSVFESSMSLTGSDLSDYNVALWANDSDISITGGSFENNETDTTGYGGAIQQYGGTLSVDGVAFTDNDADYGGAILAQSAAVTVQHSSFIGSVASEAGGAILVLDDGTLEISLSSFSENESEYGGAIYAEEFVEFTVTDSEFTDNVGDYGSAIYVYYGDDFTLDTCEFYGNSGYTVTAYYNDDITGRDLTLEDNETGIMLAYSTLELDGLVSANTEGSVASELYLSGSTLTVDNAELTGDPGNSEALVYAGSNSDLYMSNSTLTEGGDRGLYLSGDVTELDNVTITDMEEQGIYVYDGEFTATDLTISGSENSSCLYAYETDLVLEDVDLSDCNADYLGALYLGSNGELTATDLTISDSLGACLYLGSDSVTELESAELSGCENWAGGGIYMAENATLDGTDVTLRDNEATYGGGLYLYEDNSASLTDSTIEDNVASYCGGGVCLYDEDSVITFDNVDFSDNDGGDFEVYGGDTEELGTSYSGTCDAGGC